MEDAAATRQKRKEEGRKLKRKRIEESGGVRPRQKSLACAPKHEDSTTSNEASHKQRRHDRTKKSRHGTRVQNSSSTSRHRFGRVMEQAPCRNQPRRSTLSIAVPGSVVSNCQTRELKTHLVGQIARAAAIYHVDEIVVFDDKLAINDNKHFYGGRHLRLNTDEESNAQDKARHEADREQRNSDPHIFMARILQYCECPQYLRRHFFPRHPDLQSSGLLPPLDAPHHVRAEERSKYREGVVLEKKGPEGGSLVNCGIRGRPVEIDRILSAGIRCTVELDASAYTKAAHIHGTVVAPSAPREDDGTYWGYSTRLADSINSVFEDCPFGGGYDLKIGTSERGNVTVDDKSFSLPSFRHAIVVFGGVAGIEECVDADETLKIPGSDSTRLFDLWVNTCPFQGSRTIRTEEAVLLSLARLSPFLAEKAKSNVEDESSHSRSPQKLVNVELSEDEALSDESSDG